jgi:uncharacterized protein (DUF983 family)
MLKLQATLSKPKNECSHSSQVFHQVDEDDSPFSFTISFTVHLVSVCFVLFVHFSILVFDFFA